MPRRRQLEQRLGGASDRRRSPAAARRRCRRGLPPAAASPAGRGTGPQNPRNPTRRNAGFDAAVAAAASSPARGSCGVGDAPVAAASPPGGAATAAARAAGHLRRRPPPYALPLSTEHPTGAAAAAPVPRENKLYFVCKDAFVSMQKCIMENITYLSFSLYCIMTYMLVYYVICDMVLSQ